MVGQVGGSPCLPSMVASRSWPRQFRQRGPCSPHLLRSFPGSVVISSIVCKAPAPAPSACSSSHIPGLSRLLITSDASQGGTR